MKEKFEEWNDKYFDRSSDKKTKSRVKWTIPGYMTAKNTEHTETRQARKQREMKELESFKQSEFGEPEEDNAQEFIEPALVTKIYSELGIDQQTTERAIKGAMLMNELMNYTEKAHTTEHYQKKSLGQVLNAVRQLNLR